MGIRWHIIQNTGLIYKLLPTLSHCHGESHVCLPALTAQARPCYTLFPTAIGCKSGDCIRTAARLCRSRTPPRVLKPHFSGNGSAASSLSDLSMDDLPTLKSKVRVLRHVRKGARCLAAGKLSFLLERCVQSKSRTPWTGWLFLSYTTLRLPNAGDNKSLTSKVKENIIASSQSLFPANPLPQGVPSFYKSIQAKVFEGDLRGAARLLTSDLTCNVLYTWTQFELHAIF